MPFAWRKICMQARQEHSKKCAVVCADRRRKLKPKGRQMKLVCKENHWSVIDGQLILKTPNGKDTETAKQVIAVLEQQIRQRIYDDICSWEPIANRKQILKVAGTFDNALLGVQDICANIALGRKDG
jgi:hypothetical protein